MKYVTQALRIVGAFVASVICTLVLLIAVEAFSAWVHPFPADFDGSQAEMCQHVARYPAWVLAAVIPMWSLIAFIATWIAGHIGSRPTAFVIALVLLAAVGLNMSMLPYPLWFEVVQVIGIIAAILCAIPTARRASQAA